jgi:hypothetical protein
MLLLLLLQNAATGFAKCFALKTDDVRRCWKINEIQANMSNYWGCVKQRRNDWCSLTAFAIIPELQVNTKKIQIQNNPLILVAEPALRARREYPWITPWHLAPRVAKIKKVFSTCISNRFNLFTRSFPSPPQIGNFIKFHTKRWIRFSKFLLYRWQADT